MQIEAVLLTGGASARMGQDKALLELDGVPVSHRIANNLTQAGIPVTVLGRDPIPGFPFQKDPADFAGPLAALAAFQPRGDAVFVAACDLPLFDPAIVHLLASKIERCDAAVPLLDGRRQPTCALYRSFAWEQIPEGKKSLMSWLDRLEIIEVREGAIRHARIDPNHLRGFNTPDELDRLLKRQESTS